MKPEPYRIQIDGEGTLEDWYVFPHTFNQVYSFLYSIRAVSELPEQPEEDNRLFITYTAHPWTGGYSAVNFYSYLQKLVPKQLRAGVRSVHYSSPGWFELTLLLGVAVSIRKVVKAFCESGKELHSLYSEIYKGLQERKLLRMEVKSRELQLAKEHVDFMERSMESLSRTMAFDGLAELRKITNNRLAAIKILLSFYRRARTLAKYETQGKARF